MILGTCLLVIALLFVVGWHYENRFALVLAPFMIFSAYFFLRVVPGFVIGVERYGIDALYLAALVAAFLGFFLGYFSLNGYRRERVLLWVQISKLHRPMSYELPITVFAIIVLLSGLALYRGIPPTIGVALDLTTQSLDPGEAARIVAESRREITKARIFGGVSVPGAGILREVIFASALLMISHAGVYAFARRGVRSIAWLVAVVLLGYIFVSGDGTRGRFVVVMTSLAVIFTLFRRVKWADVLIGFALLVGLAIFLGLYTNKMVGFVADSAWGDIVRAALERIFIGNSINDALAVDAVESGFLSYGYGYWLLRDIAATIPGIGSDKPLSYYLYLYAVGGDSTTYLTGTSLSRAFVDAGLIGVFIYFAAIGAITALASRATHLVFGLSVGSKIAFLVAIWIASGQGYVSGVAGVLFLVAMCTSLTWFCGLVTSGLGMLRSNSTAR